MRHNRFLIVLGILFFIGLPAWGLMIGDALGMESSINDWLESHLQISHQIPIPLHFAGLLALLPIAIVLLYLLRLKRKPQVVSSTYLWKKSIEDLHVNRLLQWLRRNRLLPVQLIITLLLLYAIIAPRFHGKYTTGNHYILIIDHSASMSATDLGSAKSRLDWAKQAAIQQIDAATDNDSGMIIVFSRNAEIRQSYTNDRALLRQTVQAIEPTSESTHIDEALRLASSLANPSRSTEDEALKPSNPAPGQARTYAAPEGIPANIHLYSDGRFRDLPEFALSNLDLSFHVPPTLEKESKNNLAIVQFRAFREEEKSKKLAVRVQLMNFQFESRSVEVVLNVFRGKNQLMDVKQQKVVIPGRKIVDADPGLGDSKQSKTDFPGELNVTFELAESDANPETILQAKIMDAKDSLAVDNEAWLVLGITRKAKILFIGNENPALQYILTSEATQEIADVTFQAPLVLQSRERYLDPALSGVYDLVIFDRCAPASEEEMPRSNTCFIGFPPPPWKPVDRSRESDTYRTVAKKDAEIRGWTDQHPLMQGIRGWHELAISDSFQMTPLPPKTPRLLEGKNDHVLLMALARQSFTDVVFTFPIYTDQKFWNTNWILKPSFPIFWRNLIYRLGHVRDATTEDSLQPGDLKMFRLPGNSTTMEVRSPSGQITTLEKGTRNEWLFNETKECGIYEATAGKQTMRFAVNLFDPEESKIEPRSVVKIGAEEVSSEKVQSQPYELRNWFILAGVFFLLIEWWLYHRRIAI